jgi:cation:H+ antiporter
MLIYILFLIGFLFLVKGADFLVDSASAIAKKLKVSDLVIGLTIVAFGTSAPELVVNLFASSQGYSDVAIGNVLGSNIANILLVLGISALIFPLDVEEETVWREIPMSLGAALVLALLVNDFFLGSGPLELSRFEGVVLLLFFVIFMFYMFRRASLQRREGKGDLKVEPEVKEHGVPKALLLLTIGLIGINIGARWVVDGAVELAGALGVSQALIGLTIVAMGTSMPELATSVIAAFKKNPDIAVGNIVGSNIFNIFLILGVSATVRPLPFPAGMNLDMAVVIMASALLFIAMFTGRKRNLLERPEGAFFVILYFSYILFTIIRG